MTGYHDLIRDTSVAWHGADPAEVVAASTADAAARVIDLFRRARPSWYAEAECARAEHRDVVFLPERGQSTTDAKAVCHSCCVVDQCLAYAVADSSLVGVWGGTSAAQRKAIRAEEAAGVGGTVGDGRTSVTQSTPHSFFVCARFSTRPPRGVLERDAECGVRCPDGSTPSTPPPPSGAPS